MILSLYEPVRVGAVFEDSWPRPVWFGFQGQKVVAKEVCYRWKEREGDDTLYKFTLSDGVNLYELLFSARKMTWFLVAMEEGGVRM